MAHYADVDPVDVLSDRVSKIEQRNAEALLDAELNAVKEAMPVFKNEAAEDVLLDLIAANPRKPVADIAKGLSALLRSEEKSDDGGAKAPPDTPARLPRSGVSSAARRSTEQKAPKTIAEASALLRKQLGDGLRIR